MVFESKCPKCKEKVLQTIHEGTGKKLFMDLSGNSTHVCKPRKYWCYSCDAAIREDRPCIHKYKQEKKKEGLLSYE